MGEHLVFGDWRWLLTKGIWRFLFGKEIGKSRIGFELQDFLLDAFHHQVPSRLNVRGALPVLPLVLREPTFDELGAENHGARAKGARRGRDEHSVEVKVVDVEAFPLRGEVGEWWAVRVNKETEIP